MRAFVRNRAKNRCEYCLLHQSDSPLAPLHIEHIRPRKHGGSDEPDNLCLACIDCNLRKGSNLTGIDPATDLVTALFNPRKDLWNEHFEWKGVHVAGLTTSGRTTVQVLDLNSEDRLDLRSS
ncbi:MAG: endonuclease [Verrucomicrobiaceae bacterium]|nr:endonuclease [Verrucomicrobiaceae bacterium]